MQTQFDLLLEIEVEVQGDFLKGKPSQFNSQFGNYLPADPAEVKNMKVFLVKDNMRIEITKFLPQMDLEYLESEFISAKEEEIE